MVRKRTRTSRKLESDDEPSESDLELESPPASPGPKKYSLRQRKRPTFVNDFDYEEDGDEELPEVPSDDDEYHVEEDLEEARSAQVFRTLVRRPRISRTPRRRKSNQIDETLSSVDIIESELPLPSDEIPEDPSAVDFEDMIRADVVMNRNRIDYDNIINKTEIKMQLLDETPPPQKLIVRRGRPRKARDNIAYTENNENGSENGDGNSENNEFVVAIDPSLMLQADKDDESDKNSIDLQNGLSNSSDDLPLTKFIEPKCETVVSDDNTNDNEQQTETNSVSEEIKEPPPQEDEKEKLKFPDPSTITDEELLNNCHIESEVKFEEYNKEDTYDIFEDPKYNEEDCDDVIFIEPKQEVIVLDDD